MRMPVNPDPAGRSSTIIATWKLNETTGDLGSKGATATRVGATNVFEFTVTSFSWVNIDKPLTDTCDLIKLLYMLLNKESLLQL